MPCLVMLLRTVGALAGAVLLVLALVDTDLATARSSDTSAGADVLRR